MLVMTLLMFLQEAFSRPKWEGSRTHLWVVTHSLRSSDIVYIQTCIAFGEETTDMEIKVQDEAIEYIMEFMYLSSLLTRNNDAQEKNSRGKRK